MSFENHAHGTVGTPRAFLAGNEVCVGVRNLLPPNRGDGSTRKPQLRLLQTRHGGFILRTVASLQIQHEGL